MGKIANYSQRLYYEARLLTGLKYCQQHLDDSEQRYLATLLYQKKLAQWPDRLWNAQFAGNELQNFWNLAGKKTDSLESDLDHLVSLNQLSDIDYVNGQTQRSFEQHFRDLELYQSGGALLKETQYALQGLKLANSLLVQQTSQKPICPMGTTTPKAKIAKNVLHNRFIGQLQPKLARLNRQLIQARQALAQLLKEHSANHQAKLKEFSSALSLLEVSLQQQSKNHVGLWQQIFISCDAINPGR